MQPSTLPSSTGSLAMYLAEINKYPLLTVDEEQRLARLYARLEVRVFRPVLSAMTQCPRALPSSLRSTLQRVDREFDQLIETSFPSRKAA